MCIYIQCLSTRDEEKKKTAKKTHAHTKDEEKGSRISKGNIPVKDEKSLLAVHIRLFFFLFTFSPHKVRRVPLDFVECTISYASLPLLKATSIYTTTFNGISLNFELAIFVCCVNISIRIICGWTSNCTKESISFNNNRIQRLVINKIWLGIFLGSPGKFFGIFSNRENHLRPLEWHYEWKIHGDD